ncbi:MFS general substrate transporter [Acephala macrosclerotiorum]|nr:MFS general substrate transporter [Acephala macrosclerotiorum]
MSSEASSSSERDPQHAVLPTIAEERESLLAAGDVEAQDPPKQKFSWKNLPHKQQLAVLCLARLADSFAIYSTQAYMFYQLRYFNPDATDTQISIQAGFLVTSKTVVQLFTGVLWGIAADSQHFGRRPVLAIGLFCSGFWCIWYGFSQNILTAAVCRVFGGAMSSNVGITKTVIGDLYPEEGHRSRAFVLLPLFANIGMFLGPLVGGFSSETGGNWILKAYPFALPNIIAAALYAVAAIVVSLGLEETLPGRNESEGSVAKLLWNKLTTPHLNDPELLITSSQDTGSHNRADEIALGAAGNLSIWEVLTPNVLLTILAQFLVAGHIATFTYLWAVFLSIPVAEPKDQHGLIWFSGGLGMSSGSVGFAMSLLGAVAVVLQVFVYPILSDRCGKLRIWRYAVCIFPVAYALAPYPARFGASDFEASDILSGRRILFWLSMCAVPLLFIAGKICTTPALALLINDCTPNPSLRGRVNSAGTAAGNLGRTAFPAIVFAVFGKGLDIGIVGAGFWCLAFLAVLACIESRWVSGGTKKEKIAQEEEESSVHGEEDRGLAEDAGPEVVRPSPKSSRSAPFAPETPLRRHQGAIMPAPILDPAATIHHGAEK